MKAILVLFACLSFIAVAEGDPRKGACAPDIQKFCKGLEPGGGRVFKCLKENQSKLSAACKKEGETRHAIAMKVKEACEGDANKLCADAGQNPMRLVGCLHRNAESLSPACKTAMEKMPKVPNPEPGQ